MSSSQGYFRQFRFLFFIYVPALLIAIWEISDRVYPDGKFPDADAEREDFNYTFEYSLVTRQLYPDRPEADYYNGIDELFLRKNPQAARAHFERALSTGVKTDERLLYYYAYALVQLDEDEAVIDEAVDNWRKNFPESNLPDPRSQNKVSRIQAPPSGATSLYPPP